MSEIIELRKDDYLIRHKEESCHMYYVQEGVLGIFDTRQGMKSTKEVQIGTIYTGELVGEMSFLDKAPRSASVKAMGNCRLLVIQREKFQKIFDAQPIWYQVLINTLLDRLRVANKRVRI